MRIYFHDNTLAQVLHLGLETSPLMVVHLFTIKSVEISQALSLLNAARSARTTGKVIPELNFVFWQNMFISRHDNRIWNKQLHNVPPNLDKQIPISDSRESIYNDLQQTRMLRNRIAHHEPVFKRSLSDDHSKIITLIKYRCTITAEWLDNNQQFTAVLASKPAPKP